MYGLLKIDLLTSLSLPSDAEANKAQISKGMCTLALLGNNYIDTRPVDVVVDT